MLSFLSEFLYDLFSIRINLANRNASIPQTDNQVGMESVLKLRVCRVEKLSMNDWYVLSAPGMCSQVGLSRWGTVLIAAKFLLAASMHYKAGF